MRLAELMLVATDKFSAEAVWEDIRFPDHGVRCPHCSGRVLYHLKDGRNKCRICRRKFTLWTGTRLAGTKLRAGTWLVLVKLFELEMSARYAGSAAGINYKSAARAFRLIREAIAQTDESFCIGAGVESDALAADQPQEMVRSKAWPEPPGFRIQEQGDQVHIEVAPNVHGKTRFGPDCPIIWIRSLPYSSISRDYTALQEYILAHVLLDHEPDFADSSEVKRFLDYTDGWMAIHRGLLRRNFYLYVKEMEFRYNHRREANLFELLAKELVKPVPSTR